MCSQTNVKRNKNVYIFQIVISRLSLSLGEKKTFFVSTVSEKFHSELKLKVIKMFKL